jgi:hypothetical protein
MGGLIGGGGGGKKAAKQAKTVAADQQQFNIEAANLSAGLNRYDETNPYGSVNWTKDPVTGQWSVNQQASPQLQGAIDSSLNMQTAGNTATQGAIGRVAGTIGSAFNPTLPGMGQTPTADPQLRTMPGSNVPVTSGPNAGPVQTGLGNYGNAFAAAYGAGAVPGANTVNPADAGNIMSAVQNAGPINQSVGLQTGLGDAGQINRGQNLPAGNVPGAEGYQRGLDYSGAPSLYGSGNVSNDYNSAVSTAFGAQKANIDEAYSTQRSQLEQRLAVAEEALDYVYIRSTRMRGVITDALTSLRSEVGK